MEIWCWAGAPSIRDAKGRRESGVLQFLSLTGGPAVLKDQVIHIPAANRLVSHHFISSFAFGFSASICASGRKIARKRAPVWTFCSGSCRKNLKGFPCPCLTMTGEYGILIIADSSQVRVLSPQPESPDFLRNQDFFRTFVSNNLLAIFSDPNADPNGTGSGKHYTAPERMLPIVFAASRLAEVVTCA